MSKVKPAYPTEFFDQKTLDQTYSFIDTLKPNDIRRFRQAYRREMNQSNDDNVLPETTLTMRRCFLYLTSNYEQHNL
jgi:hypothetical protein